MLQLIITRDDDHIQTKVLAPGEYSVGRLEENDIVLDDRQVSRRHARLVVTEQGASLEDLGSSNKMVLDGQEMDTIALRPDQAVTIRPFVLSFASLPDMDDKTIVLGAGAGEVHEDATMIMAGPSAAPKMKLIVVQGQDQGAEYDLRPGSIILGRAEECDVRLNDPSVSRRHAQVEVESDRILIKDLGSTVGTFVNDDRIQEHALSVGDVLRLGGSTLELSSDSAKVIEKHIPGKQRRAGGSPKPVKVAKQGSGGKGKVIAAAFVILAVVTGAAVFFLGSDAEKPHQVVVEAEEQARATEMDQVQRLVAINLVRGKQALEAENFQEAVESLQKVVIADPAHEEGRALLVEAQRLLEAYQAEQKRLEEEQLALEQKIAQLMHSAQQAMEGRNYSRAIDSARQVLAMQDDHDDARELLGKAEAAQRDVQRRRQQAQAAAQKLESDAKNAFERGQALRQQGKLVEAVRAWEQLQQVDSRRQTQYPSEADGLIRQVKQELSTRSAPMVEAAASQVQSAPRRAYDSLQAALRVDPWNERAKQLLAEVQRHLVVEARKLFDEGLVLESLGSFNQACEKWRMALDWVPTSDELHQRIKAKEAQCR